MSENFITSIVAAVADRGWVHLPGFLDDDLRAALFEEAQGLKHRFQPAAVGRGEGRQLAPYIRQTAICWLAEDTDAQRALWARCEIVRQGFNRVSFAGLATFEAHFAIYPEGGFYRPHVDAFAHPIAPAGPLPMRGHAAPVTRRLSFVAYLNPAWQADWGGALRLWTPPGDGFVAPDAVAEIAARPADDMIYPSPGSVVLMRAEDVVHEVMPTAVRRVGIAGWWRGQPSPLDLARGIG